MWSFCKSGIFLASVVPPAQSKMRLQRIFFFVLCLVAVVMILGIMNGHRFIRISSAGTRDVKKFPSSIRNYFYRHMHGGDIKNGHGTTLLSKPLASVQGPDETEPTMVGADADFWLKTDKPNLSVPFKTSNISKTVAMSWISSEVTVNHRGVAPTQPCTPHKNIVFFKMHKCGSSTVQNILFRYGENNDLDFVMPPTGNYLGHSPFNKRYMLHLPTKQYNILCHHTRFSEKGMAEVMPADSVYVSIVREPVGVFESTFTYNKYSSMYHLSEPNPLKQFLKNPRKYYNNHGGKDHAKNPMMYDFGLENHVKDDQVHIDTMIQRLDKRFDLIMMTEYFHESLILFKELMCWSLDDIVYFTLNARSKSSVLTDITPAMRYKMRHWNMADTKLYNHFNKTFWEKVHQFGKDRMRREIQQLVERNRYLFEHCIASVSNNDTKVWHPPGIKVESVQLKPSAKNDQQCIAMARTELPYTAHLLERMKAKYHIK